MLQHEHINPGKTELEWLSALLDGEIDDAEGARALERLSQDQTLKRRWSEYCLIGDTLRGEALVQPDLDQRLRTALAAEPTLLAPVKRERHSRQYMRPVAWTAAAAAVAAVTWTVWTALPQHTAPARMVARPEAVMIQASHVMPYLDAHQDFAQGVVAHPEMRFSTVTLVGLEDGR
ncbi:MAG: sigma-E factor negative regulatory protein [Thiobacillaceae bacterium]